MTVKLLWRSDVHMADRGPSTRLDNWTESVLDKLRQVGQIARERGVDAVLDGGDFFHVKPPMNNSHSMVHQVIQVHQDYPCPVYANVGNHDCVYGNYAYLDQQPLGILFTGGVFKRLYDEHELFLDRGGVRVRVVGVPYHGTVYDMDRFKVARGSEDYLVMAAHVLASPTGGSMFEGEDIVRYSDLLLLDPDVFCFGHWHKDQGVEEIANGRWVVNVGSLTRGSLSADNLERIPSVVYMEFSAEGIKLEKIPLRVKPASEVFDVERRIRLESRGQALESYVEVLHDLIKGGRFRDSKSDLESVVLGLKNVSQTVRERAHHILQQVE